MNHFRDPQKAADMSKLSDRWRLRLWMRTILVSGGHCMGTPARVRRCRSIWRRPEGLRWVKRVGDSWNTATSVRSRSHRHNAEVYIPLMRKMIRHGGQKGCMACCRHGGAYSQESRTRLQDTADNENAQSGKASSTDSTRTNSTQYEQWPRAELKQWCSAGCG